MIFNWLYLQFTWRVNVWMYYLFSIKINHFAHKSFLFCFLNTLFLIFSLRPTTWLSNPQDIWYTIPKNTKLNIIYSVQYVSKIKLRKIKRERDMQGNILVIGIFLYSHMIQYHTPRRTELSVSVSQSSSTNITQTAMKFNTDIQSSKRMNRMILVILRLSFQRHHEVDIWGLRQFILTLTLSMVFQFMHLWF